MSTVTSTWLAFACLAALDSARPPRGPALVAEADSRMLAALPLGSGRPIADPFEPTAEIVALLGKKQVSQATPAAPQHTIDSVKRDVDTIKGGGHA